LSAGTSAQTRLGELTALPQARQLYFGDLLLKGWEWGEEERRGKAREGVRPLP